MRSLIYCRVSTREQAESGTSLDTQEQACLERATALGDEVVEVVRDDHTGTDLSRPGIEKVRQLALAQAFDRLIVYTLDRLYRPKSEGDEWRVFSLIDQLRSSQVTVEFVDSSIPSTGELSGVIQFLRAWQAGQERTAFIERTTRGKRARALEGKMPHGTGVGIYGYDYHSDTKQRSVNESQAEVVRRVYNWAIEGVTAHKISQILNREGIPTLTGKSWHPRTISNMLSRESYKGITTFFKTKRVSGKTVAQPRSAWIISEGVTPVIVTPEIWDHAQTIKEQRGGRRSSRSYLLSGFARCGFCDSRMSGHTMNKRYSYYRCPNMLKTTRNPVTCGQRYVRMNELDEAVWDSVVKILSEPQLIVEEMRRAESDTSPAIQEEITSIESRLVNAKDREYRLMRLFEIGNIDEALVIVRLSEIRDEQIRMQSELTKAKSDLASAQRIRASAEDIEVAVSQIKGHLKNADFDLKRLALNALQIQVTVHQDRIDLGGAVPLTDEMQSNIGHHWTNIGITTCV